MLKVPCARALNGPTSNAQNGLNDPHELARWTPKMRPSVTGGAQHAIPCTASFTGVSGRAFEGLTVYSVYASRSTCHVDIPDTAFEWVGHRRGAMTAAACPRFEGEPAPKPCFIDSKYMELCISVNHRPDPVVSSASCGLFCCCCFQSTPLPIHARRETRGKGKRMSVQWRHNSHAR